MRLIGVIMHLITCLCGHVQLKENLVEHDLKLCSEFIASSFGIITFAQTIALF